MAWSALPAVNRTAGQWVQGEHHWMHFPLCKCKEWNDVHFTLSCFEVHTLLWKLTGLITLMSTSLGSHLMLWFLSLSTVSLVCECDYVLELKCGCSSGGRRVISWLEGYWFHPWMSACQVSFGQHTNPKLFSNAFAGVWMCVNVSHEESERDMLYKAQWVLQESSKALYKKESIYHV